MKDEARGRDAFHRARLRDEVVQAGAVAQRAIERQPQGAPQRFFVERLAQRFGAEPRPVDGNCAPGAALTAIGSQSRGGSADPASGAPDQRLKPEHVRLDRIA